MTLRVLKDLPFDARAVPYFSSSINQTLVYKASHKAPCTLWLTNKKGFTLLPLAKRDIFKQICLFSKGKSLWLFNKCLIQTDLEISRTSDRLHNIFGSDTSDDKLARPFHCIHFISVLTFQGESVKMKRKESMDFFRWSFIYAIPLLRGKHDHMNFKKILSEINRI